MAESRRTVKAVDITCEILRTLQDHERAGVTELADELGYAKSAIHTHLMTLEQNELVVKEGTTYRLSLRFLDIAESVKTHVQKLDVINEEVKSLAEETGELVQFGTEEHGWVVYLCKEKGEKGIESASEVGGRQPIHSTSIGKAILSRYPEERVSEIVDRRGLPQQTENTVRSEEELLDVLASARARGYTIDDEENVRGIRCIGVPIYEEGGEVLGALSITGPSQRITDERIETELSGAISKSANVIQVNYKFS